MGLRREVGGVRRVAAVVGVTVAVEAESSWRGRWRQRRSKGRRLKRSWRPFGHWLGSWLVRRRSNPVGVEKGKGALLKGWVRKARRLRMMWTWVVRGKTMTMGLRVAKSALAFGGLPFVRVQKRRKEEKGSSLKRGRPATAVHKPAAKSAESCVEVANCVGVQIAAAWGVRALTVSAPR